ncbi:MAG TPA: C40 family peptidase [Fimbriimonas sp.]
MLTLFLEGSPTAASEQPDGKDADGKFYASAPKQKKTSSTAQENVIKTAKGFRGVRYRWGGTSRSGVDCSGFTTQVFRAHGLRLPRTSVEQARVGKPVKGGLQAGDLVFFRTTRGSRISHVGIYIGNGKFIHASSGGGKVQVNSLREGYYRSRFVTARRVVNSSVGTEAARQAADIMRDPDPVAFAASSQETSPNPVQVRDEVGR